MQLHDLSLRNPASLGLLLETVRASQALVQAKQIAPGSQGIVQVSQTIARRFSRHGLVSHKLAPFNQEIVLVSRTIVLRCNQSIPTNRKLDRYILITDLLSLKCDRRPDQGNLRFDQNNHSRDQPSLRLVLNRNRDRNSRGHSLNGRNRDRCRNLNLVRSL